MQQRDFIEDASSDNDFVKVPSPEPEDEIELLVSERANNQKEELATHDGTVANADPNSPDTTLPVINTNANAVLN